MIEVVHYWHEADIAGTSLNVRFRGLADVPARRAERDPLSPPPSEAVEAASNCAAPMFRGCAPSSRGITPKQ